MKIVNIENVWLWNVTMLSSCLEHLVKLIENVQQQVTVDMWDCTITPEEEFKTIKHYIETSEKFVVVYDGKLADGRYSFEFTSIC